MQRGTYLFQKANTVRKFLYTNLLHNQQCGQADTDDYSDLNCFSIVHTYINDYTSVLLASGTGAGG